MMRLHRKNKRKGFTLIELLAVLVILAVVSAIAVPIFTNKDLASKQIAHNKTVETLVKQAYSYLLSKDTVTESDDIMQELIDNGYIKERPKYPLGDEEYLVRVDANGRVTVTPGMVEVTGVATGGSSGGEETPEEPEEPEEPEPEPEPIPPEGEQATVLNDVDGDGFKDIWYLEQLAYINTNTTTLAGSYELMRSLDFTNANSYLNTDNQTTWTSGEGWLPIGNNTTPFTGKFNGNNYNLHRLYVNRPETSYIGLFGYLNGATCQTIQVGINDANIVGKSYVGGIVGYQERGTISDCYVTGIATSIGMWGGGLVGYQRSGGIVNNCYSTVDVTAGFMVGGLIGQAEGTLSNSFAVGNVVKTDLGVGGEVGGLVGRKLSGTIKNCYRLNTSTVNGSNTNGSKSNIDGFNLTQEELQSGTFMVYYLGWDLDTIWRETDSYPKLGGEGLEKYENTNIISKIEDLLLINENLSGTYTIANDLDFNNDSDYRNPNNKEFLTTGTGMLPLGKGNSFTGIIDGNNYVIKNLYINRQASYQGLFESISGTSEIKQLGLVNINITGLSNQGGIVGKQSGGTINNCYITGNISGSEIGNCVGGITGELIMGIINDSNFNGTIEGYTKVGGIVGGQTGGTVSSCYITGNITSSGSVGGIVGFQDNGNINYCYTTEMAVINGNNRVGGILGDQEDGTINNCYAKGTVSGGINVGGIVGHVYGNNAITNNCYTTATVMGTNSYIGGIVGNLVVGKVYNCFSTGNITGSSAGGIAGMINSGTVSNCYRLNTATVNNLTTNGTSVNSNGFNMTQTELQSETILLYFLDWNLDTIWRHIDGDYPVLGGEGLTKTYINTNTITKIEDLMLIKDNLAGTYSLENDLDFNNEADYRNPANKDFFTSGTGWIPLGINNNKPFTGIFIGNNHTISNLYINRMTSYQGLFGYVSGASTEIKELGVKNANITGSYYLGGLVGYYNQGLLSNCYTTGILSISGNEHLGGAIGYQNNVIVSNCYTTGTVLCNGNRSGGLVGYQKAGTISHCYVTGDINGYNNSGGLVGYMDSGATIEKCYVSGDITGNSNVGGLVGRVYGATINNCYTIGSVTGTSTMVGGLIGHQESSSTVINNCYTTGNTTGSYYVGGLVGYKYFGTINNSYATGNVTKTNLGISGEVGGLVGNQLYGSINNCFRLDTATVNGTTTNGTTSNINGANRTITELQSESFIRDTLLWDATTIWQAVVDNWPVLR